jgi:trehalose 6-phosphate phosphatase
VEYLFSAWDKFARSLAGAKHIFIMSDFDGTLAAIAESPDLVVLPDDSRKILQSLAKQSRLTVGIISGRGVTDLKNIVAVNGIVYAGNHGLEIEGPGLNFVYPITTEVTLFFGIIHQMLVKVMSSIRGVVVENKGMSLSVHYRQVEDGHVDEVKSAFEHVVVGAQAMGKVKITAGKKVLEVRPVVDWNKGKAVKIIIETYGKHNKAGNVVPIYIGDDQTDEDAFSEIGKFNNGIAVFVGNEQEVTGARYYLNSPVEVVRFLRILLEIEGKR